MVEILKSGVYDTIQDMGRLVVQQYGVPLSGAMDQYSAKLANAILDNRPNDAVLEMTLIGPKLKFHIATTVCITGADFNTKLGASRVKNNLAFQVEKGDELYIGGCQKGCRGYLAVKGGFKSERVMNSRSMYATITSVGHLKRGGRLPIPLVMDAIASKASIVTPSIHFEAEELTVIKGVEFDQLQNQHQQELLKGTFTVSKDSNRMAYQLDEQFQNTLKTIITSLVLPGTVQLTPSGQLLILMRDCQTTGGYPRVLQLTEQAINRLAQKQPGQKFRFKFNNG